MWIASIRIEKLAFVEENLVLTVFAPWGGF